MLPRSVLWQLGASACAVTLLAVVTLTSPRTTVLLPSRGFTPWMASSWDERAGQGLDAQGQDEYDQPGMFVGNGYMGATSQRVMPGTMLAQGAARRTVLLPSRGFTPWMASSWDERAGQGMDAQGNDEYDQPGMFIGNGYMGANGQRFAPERAYKARVQSLTDIQGSGARRRRAEKIASMGPGMGTNMAFLHKYDGKDQSTKAKMQSLYQESFAQAMKSQHMYEKPRNNLLHVDSAGHVDMENFGNNLRERFTPFEMKPGVARDH